MLPNGESEEEENGSVGCQFEVADAQILLSARMNLTKNLGMNLANHLYFYRQGRILVRQACRVN